MARPSRLDTSNPTPPTRHQQPRDRDLISNRRGFGREWSEVGEVSSSVLAPPAQHYEDARTVRNHAGAGCSSPSDRDVVFGARLKPQVFHT